MRYLLLLLALTLGGPVMAQEKPANVVTVATYKALPKKGKGVLVDVRTPEEFKSGHVKKALNADLRGGQFAQEFNSWDKSKTYYLYCASGNRSGQALKLMQEAGFTHVYNLGAYKDLKAGGLKTEEPKK